MSKKHKRPTRRQRSGVPWPGGPWSVISIVGGLIVLSLAAFLFWRGQSQPTAAIEVTGRPSLKVNQETIDLGSIRLGQTVQATFELTNVGDQPLRFSEAPYIEVVEGC
jgi:hypothetical protein